MTSEAYTLASGPIDFYDVATGEVVFTIDANDIVVGATDSGPDDAEPHDLH